MPLLHATAAAAAAYTCESLAARGQNAKPPNKDFTLRMSYLLLFICESREIMDQRMHVHLSPGDAFILLTHRYRARTL